MRRYIEEQQIFETSVPEDRLSGISFERVTKWTRPFKRRSKISRSLPVHISFRDISDIFWRKDRVEKEIHLRFRVLGVTFNCNLRALKVKFLVSRAMFSGVCVAWSTFDLSFVPAVLPVGLLAPFTAKFSCGWDLLDLAPLHLLYLQRGRNPAFNLVKLQNHHCFAKSSYRPWWIATNHNRIATKAALVKNERNTATIFCTLCEQRMHAELSISLAQDTVVEFYGVKYGSPVTIM